MTEKPPLVTRNILHSLILGAIFLVQALPAPAAQVTVETKPLASPAADPFVTFVSVGPKHEFEPIYRVLEPGACSVLALRVLILRYAYYESIIVEELGFSGSKCQDINVRRSLSMNGVTLGYALGEGTRFAWNLEFLEWEDWDTFLIRSATKNFRFQFTRDGAILAEPALAYSSDPSGPMDEPR